MGVIRKSQLSKSKQDHVNEHFVAGATARCAVNLCNKDPGYEIDLYVKAHICDLTEVWVNRRRLNKAVRDGSLKLEGALRQVRNFSKCFSLSMLRQPPCRPIQWRRHSL
tara:strand:+ start:343 stop:669 length:327 start_codon:yes stop_codon:yes gene_type:complete